MVGLRILALLGSVFAWPVILHGQVVERGQRGPRLEARVEGTAARDPSVHIGGGANVVLGPYLRGGVVVAGGRTFRDSTSSWSWRADLLTRFVLDPFLEARRGLYGIAGLTAMHAGHSKITPRLLVGIGIEGSPHGAVIPAFEISLGGGVRASGILRRTRRGRR